MAYFLKKTNNKKGLYLQIYESFYDPVRKQTAHRSVKPIGYVHELEASGIEYPIEHFKAQVDELNEKRKSNERADRTRRIEGAGSQRLLGYFPFKGINESLRVKQDFGYLQMSDSLRFSLYDMTSSLVYARLCAPCSKSKTFHDVLPTLVEPCGFSLDQLYAGLELLGHEYEKVIEIYNAHVEDVWPHRCKTTYFDCTNFYFEIDREDGLRRKGPSKENRHDPIIGMGLLLDADLIPLGMKVFGGNESEKPVLREVLACVKRRCGIKGRTVRVADKGLNCADNIADAIVCGDGYIFSKSIKQLEEKERVWALADEGFEDVRDANGDIAYRLKEAIGDFRYRVTDDGGVKRKVELTEKRVVSYNPALARKQLHEINRQIEKARSLKLAAAKRSEYGDSAKYVRFASVDANGEITEDRVALSLNHEAIDRAREVAGYNMIVTSESTLSARDVYSTYHNLWRIEESFKVMKSQLDARPVYLQKDETITGHFLICYISVLLMRLLQFKVLDSAFSSEEIMAFARGFKVAEVTDRKYVNLSKHTPLIEKMEQLTRIPLCNYYLGKKDIEDISTWKPKVKNDVRR